MLLLRLLPPGLLALLLIAIERYIKKRKPAFLRPNGVIFAWPRSCQNHTGLPQTQAIGRHFSVVFADRQIANPQVLLSNTESSGSCVHFEDSKHKDGSKCAYVLRVLKRANRISAGYQLYCIPYGKAKARKSG
jgi:hypothetical protein